MSVRARWESVRCGEEREGKRERERGRRVDDVCFAVVDISVLSVFSAHPYPSFGLSLSLHRVLSSSIVLSILLRQRFPARFRRSSHFFLPSLSLSFCGRTVEIQRSDEREKERGGGKRMERLWFWLTMNISSTIIFR